ncbi:MAG: glycosyltransferase, partial [Chitinispirillaceae bacterium]
YKRLDLAVDAFNELGLPLLVVGEGPARKDLMRRAKKNITFLGHISASEVETYMAGARAFVFCAEEDFGIVNVEAQAAGIPVIAFGRGGALETIIDGKTGLFFYKHTVESLINSVRTFLSTEHLFDPEKIRKNALRFPRSRFEKEFKKFIDDAWERFPYKQ